MGHIIDGVAEHDGRLDNLNAAVVVAGAGVGLGIGITVGSDTPSTMIGGHVGSWVAIRLGWPVVFVQFLIVAGVGAGISATFLAQLAAVFFALEVVLGGFGGAVFVVPTLLAVAAAALTAFKLIGTPPIYALPADAIRWDASTACSISSPRWSPRSPPSPTFGCSAAMIARSERASACRWARMAIAGAIVGAVASRLPDVPGSGTSYDEGTVRRGHDAPAVLIGLAVAETILTPSSLGRGLRRRRHRAGHAHRLDHRRSGGDRRHRAGAPTLGSHPSCSPWSLRPPCWQARSTPPLLGAMMIFGMNRRLPGCSSPLLAAAAIGYGAGAAGPDPGPPIRSASQPSASI